MATRTWCVRPPAATATDLAPSALAPSDARAPSRPRCRPAPAQIEWCLGIIDLGWTSKPLFHENLQVVSEVAELVDTDTPSEHRIPTGTPTLVDRLSAQGPSFESLCEKGRLLPLFTLLQLAHNLLKRLLTSNHANALIVDARRPRPRTPTSTSSLALHAHADAQRASRPPNLPRRP